MPWYAWLMLVLLVCVVAASVIYILMVSRRRTPEELRNELDKSKKAEADAKAKLDIERIAREKAEKERAANELALLELQHKKELEALSEMEKEEYEKAKKDPQSGIDFMRDLLGDGTSPGEG